MTNSYEGVKVEIIYLDVIKTCSMDTKGNTYPRRSIASYLWEFILLFLAVFLALFVHEYLKNQKESNKESLYARQIVSDLRSDISGIEKNVRLRNGRYDQLDSMFAIIGSKKIFGHENELYFFARLITGEVAYIPNDHSIKRLKSPEGYSLMGMKAAVDTILSYDLVLDALDSYQKMESEKRKLLAPYIAKIFNPYELEKIEAEDGSIRAPVSSPFLRNADPELLNDFSYHIQDYKSAIRKTIRSLRGLQVRAKRIIEFLDTKYP